MRCKNCGGSMLPDRLERDWRCLMCSRLRNPRHPRTIEKQRPAFRRVWDVDTSELLTEHGKYAEEVPS